MGNKLNLTRAHYLFTFFIIYITDSLLFGANEMMLFKGIQRFGVIIVAVAMVVHEEQVKKKKFDLLPLFLTACMAMTMMLSGRITNGYFYYTMIASFWFAYLFARKCTLEQFSYCFCKYMRIIAIVSLIGWFFSDIIKNIPAIPVVTNTVGAKYKTLILTSIPMKGGISSRNMGPFWEPGAYQVYLNLALFFALFIEKDNNKAKDGLLFIATCLTTKSGASLIPIVLILCAYTFEKKQLKTFFMVAIFGTLIILMFNTGMFGDITAKMTNQAETNSIIYRWIGIEGSIKGFADSPLFGNTPEMNEYIKARLALKYTGKAYASNTNTYLNFFAYFGIFLGSFMSIRTYKLAKNSAKSLFAGFLVFLAIFISTSNENMMKSLIIMVLAFLNYGTKDSSDGLLEEIENEGCTD